MGCWGEFGSFWIREIRGVIAGYNNNYICCSMKNKMAELYLVYREKIVNREGIREKYVFETSSDGKRFEEDSLEGLAEECNNRLGKDLHIPKGATIMSISGAQVVLPESIGEKGVKKFREDISVEELQRFYSIIEPMIGL